MSRTTRWEPVPDPYWHSRHLSLVGEPLRERQVFFLDAWLRFLKLCTLLKVPSSDRLLFIHEPGYRTYLRWNRKSRMGIPFRPPGHAELICSVIDVLEALLDQEVSPGHASRLDRQIRRSPFKQKTLQELLLRADPWTNRELWLVLRYPVEGGALIKKLRELPRQ